MMLAQSVVEIPLTDTMKTVIGLIGIITLGIGVLSFVILAQLKLLERHHRLCHHPNQRCGQCHHQLHRQH
jgi:hypothetical protein